MKVTQILPPLKIPPSKVRYRRFQETGRDYTGAWSQLLQGKEQDFPSKASWANHYFPYPHEINGEYRDYFDCTDTESFRLIPPTRYLRAYYRAQALKII